MFYFVLETWSVGTFPQVSVKAHLISCFTVSESVFTYTDYHYTIVFWLHSTTVNDNQEGLEFETQVEIWSKSKDPIPRETMWYLKRKAEQTLCVQIVDFIDQQLGEY